MNDIFGIPVEVLDSLPDGQVLLVNRKTWEQMKSAERRAPGRGRRVSEQWLGLHNQDDHEWGWGERDAWCTTCEGPRRDRGQCLAKEPCRCCLAAEVEALRNSLGHCAAENATLRENDVLWRSRMKTAEAQVQRVRDMCDGIEPDHSVFVGDVLDALNGGRR